MRIVRTGMVMLLALISVAGCSSASKPTQAIDPNAFPADYKNQIAAFLSTVLTDRADFRNSLIAPPALKPVGSSQHYVVCLQFSGRSQHKDKVVIYLGGSINQYVDATPDQCGGAAYEPFKELAVATPS